MVDEEELRARIAARIASLGAAESGASDAAPQERTDGPDASSVDGPIEDHEPLEPEQSPPVPRFLEPVRPWLDGSRASPGSDSESAGGSPAGAPPAPADPAEPGEPGAGGRTLDPVRPWQVRNPTQSAGVPSAPPPPPAADAPDGTSAHPLQPVRPWLYQRAAEPGSRPRTATNEPPRRERPESRLLPRPPAPTGPTGPPRVEPPPVESPASPTHHAGESSEHKRRWRRTRDEVDDDESMADWLAPTDADARDTGTAAGKAAEPLPTLEPTPTVEPVPIPEPPASTDDEPSVESDEARQGRLRRALDWLLEPADPANPAPDDGESFDDPFGADDQTHVMPRVAVPILEEPVAETVEAAPEPVLAGVEEPEPEAEPMVPTPGADLARRLAAAHAAAKDRAFTAAPVQPEDADEDVARPADPPPVHSPLVTGAAFAKRTAAADASPADSGADDEVPDVRKRPRRTLHRLIVTAVVIAFAGVAALLLRAFVVAPYYIPSASMEPTLHGCSGCNNDHVLVNKLSYRVHGIHRGDVVVFHRPNTWQVSDKILIKRVIGVPGDVLTTRNGIVYVDGLQLEEPYLDPNCKGGTVGLPGKSVTVAPDTAFVMGDNRCDSSDSRRFGAIPDSSVIGRAFVTIWPFGRIHWL